MFVRSHRGQRTCTHRLALIQARSEGPGACTGAGDIINHHHRARNVNTGGGSFCHRYEPTQLAHRSYSVKSRRSSHAMNRFTDEAARHDRVGVARPS
jgi:hypothetical protein